MKARTTAKKHENIKQMPVYKPPNDLPFYFVISFFLIITIIFFWDQFSQNSFFWEDFIEYVFPVQSYAAKEFANGNLPFWNPFTFNGMPFIADLQVGFFYPLNRLLSLIFITSNNLPAVAIEIIIILHFFISLINMYYLGRYWKISTFGSMIAAISYTFSMLMVCHTIHPMMIYHLAWLPLIIMLFIKGINEVKYFYSILAGLILGMVMLSGHPQTTLYSGLLLAIIFVWNFILGIREKRFTGLKIPGVVIAAIIPVVIGIGIFTVQYLPSRELASLSQRNEINYEKATEGSLQFKQVYASVVPKIFGFVDGPNEKEPSFYLDSGGGTQKHFYWETIYYFGLAALLLGLFGAACMYKTREGSLLIIIVLFGFLYALGDGGVIFNIFYNFPLFGSFRNPARIMFYVILGFSLLAGFGFDSLYKRIHKYNLLFLIIAGIFPLIVTLMTSSGSLSDVLNTPENLRVTLQEAATTSMILFIIIYSIALLINRTILPPTIGGIALVIIVFVDLYIAGSSFNQGQQNPAKVYEMKPDIKTMLTPKLPDNLFRVNMRLYKPIKFMALQRNQGLIDNIMLVEGYNPLILERVKPPIDDASLFYDLYNAKYEVKVDLDKGSWAFAERGSYFPRAWLVFKAHVFPPEKVENSMRNGNFNYRNEAVLEEKPANMLTGIPADSVAYSDSCQIYTGNYIRYFISTPVNGIMCFSEIWYPAWKVYVDGKPAKLLRANYCFRAVEVPEGNHTVEMKYESATFMRGLYISFGTLLVSLIGMMFAYRYQNKVEEMKLRKK